nr:GW dipeptide domain-containing protein [Carnobacterium sp. ISL-102]
MSRSTLLKTYDEFLTKKSVDYYATVLSNNEGIYTKPNGMEGAVLYTSYMYNNKEVKVGEEATTQSGTFVKLIRIEDNGTIGWIKKSGISIKIFDEFLTKKNVNYYATVLTNNEGIFTKPDGMAGAVLYTNYKYNNKDVRVGEEATTQSGTFVKLVRIEDNGTIGWIKKSSISVKTFDEFSTKKNVNYYATVLTSNEGIYTKPNGMLGAVLYTNYKYNNKDVRVGEEATTQSGTFVKLVRIEDNGTIGWVKKAGISVKIYDEFLTKKSVDYYATVLTNNEGIYTKPDGMAGSVLYTSYKYNNQDVRVGEEATTQSGTFVKLLRTEDSGIIGWIKKSSVKIHDRIISQKLTSYRAKVETNNDGIYTLPKGMYGSTLYTNYLYNGQNVQVTQEAITESGVFAEIARIDNGIVIGWINKKSLNTEKIVFLDAGHGGTESGASYYGTNEKDLNLQVTKKVKTNLEALGFTVLMSRETDKTMGLLARSMAVNVSGADIFVSIHHNAMPGNTAVTGIETYYYQYDSDYPSKMNEQFHNDPTRILESSKLATNVQSSLIYSTRAINRGVKRNTFSVLRETAIPAVLLELGYMSSPTELAKLKTDSYQNTLSKAITNGIVAYFK